MNLLPLEIVHRILEYDGRIKYRHGKYMNQIASDDERYKMLLTLPIILPCTPEWSSSCYIILHKNLIYCTKRFDASYTGETPIYEINYCGKWTNYFYTKEGISYCWTIYYKEIK